ncbi:MAG: hypothetical protein JEY71_16970 [Sphaerochaeta sp.]|nr:hypothetical protein [Sphaerochaeta sp.]
MVLTLTLAPLAFLRVVFISNPSSISAAFTLTDSGFAIVPAGQVITATIIGALLSLGAAALILGRYLIPNSFLLGDAAQTASIASEKIFHGLINEPY